MGKVFFGRNAVMEAEVTGLVGRVSVGNREAADFKDA